MTLEARRFDEAAPQEPLRSARSAGGGPGFVSDVAGLDRPQGRWQRAFPLMQERQQVRARHSIYRAGDLLDGVPIVHSGWAARVRRLPDGRRQILSFIL